MTTPARTPGTSAAPHTAGEHLASVEELRRVSRLRVRLHLATALMVPTTIGAIAAVILGVVLGTVLLIALLLAGPDSSMAHDGTIPRTAVGLVACVVFGFLPPLLLRRWKRSLEADLAGEDELGPRDR